MVDSGGEARNEEGAKRDRSIGVRRGVANGVEDSRRLPALWVGDV
jgi:hypothetical protein